MVNESLQLVWGRNRVTIASLLLLSLFHLGLPALQGVAHAAGGDQPVAMVKEESITEGVKAVIEDTKALVLSPLTIE